MEGPAVKLLLAITVVVCSLWMHVCYHDDFVGHCVWHFLPSFSTSSCSSQFGIQEEPALSISSLLSKEARICGIAL
jgi:hypothetical protein